MGKTEVRPVRLGEWLLSQGHLSDDQLITALQEQRSHPESLGRVLVRLGFIDEPALCHGLAAQNGTAVMSLDGEQIPANTLALLSPEIAHRLCAIPVEHHPNENYLIIALAEPGNLGITDALRAALPTGLQLEFRLAGEGDIRRALAQHYPRSHQNMDIRRLAPSVLATPGLPGDSGASARIDAILLDAVDRQASDIHFEPEAGFLRLRYRIDGLLQQICVIHESQWPAMCVRLKVLSAMNIAEARAPQDGRFSQTLHGRRIDFRAASQPTLHGENIVLRLLDREKGIVPLTQLGLSEQQRESILDLLARPEGLLLVTGPTGSGKTTTLYSLLDHLNEEGVNIMTLEDPVEYPLARLRQTSLNEAVKLDFASGVRALMRQDPDILLIGEIRDGETASMAFRAALTGHQVLATLHANHAPGALPRLFDLGVSAELLAGNLTGILAQRLVRRLCPDCKNARPPNPIESALFSRHAVAPPPLIHSAEGCARCAGRGYRGRLAILEILAVDSALDNLIAERAPPPRLHAHLEEIGHRGLIADGLRQVGAGATSLGEVQRVLGGRHGHRS